MLTRDHAIDQAAIEDLLHLGDLSYLGLIASRSKVERFQKRIANKVASGGMTNSEPTAVGFARIHAPVGIEIGAETPDEIAVSVVADLIKTRRMHSLL